MLAFATRRAEPEGAMSTESVALFCALIEHTDCVATSELSEVGVIASVLSAEHTAHRTGPRARS